MRLQVALILRARQKNTKTYDLTSPEKNKSQYKTAKKSPSQMILRSLKSVYTPEVWHSPWKLMVGRLLSHWVSVIFQWQTVKLQVGIGYHIQFPGLFVKQTGILKPDGTVSRGEFDVRSLLKGTGMAWHSLKCILLDSRGFVYIYINIYYTFWRNKELKNIWSKIPFCFMIWGVNGWSVVSYQCFN